MRIAWIGTLGLLLVAGCGLGGAQPTSVLENLQPSFGSLSPAFDPDVEEYTLDAGFFGRSVQFTPTVDDSSSTVEVDGEAVQSGEPSLLLPLDVGETTFDVVVTASDDEQTTYTIVVTRAASISDEHLLEVSNAAPNLASTSVAMHGDTVVVGAAFESSDGSGGSNVGAPSSGAVYVFTRDSMGWTQEAFLKASNLDADDQFGGSVSIHGDTIVVGAVGEASDGTSEDDNSAVIAGAAYVFTRSGSTWEQQAYLKASNADIGDLFGKSVSVHRDTIIVGAFGESSDGTSEADNSAGSSGAAYVFVRTGDEWSQEAYLKASNLELGDQFGDSVCVHNDTIVVATQFEDSDGSAEADNSAPFAGAAYVFTRAGTTWEQEAYLKASNAGENDAFGASVSLHDDTIVVGALGEGSDGVSEGDDSAAFSGAAYVFTRAEGSWTQQAYLKASFPDSSDLFGVGVAVHGDTIVVGASGEDSDGSDEMDNSANGAGAAYVFIRSGSSWTQDAYLKGLSLATEFGGSVAVHGDTVAVIAQNAGPAYAFR